MGKRAQLEPAWLVGLLNAWARRSLAEQTRGIGWHTICPMLQSGIPGRARSYEPTGYCADDHQRTLTAINALPMRQRLAVARYFKPWAKLSIEAEHHWSDDTWMRELRTAMDALARELAVQPVAQSVAIHQDCG